MTVETKPYLCAQSGQPLVDKHGRVYLPGQWARRPKDNPREYDWMRDGCEIAEVEFDSFEHHEDEWGDFKPGDRVHLRITGGGFGYSPDRSWEVYTDEFGCPLPEDEIGPVPTERERDLTVEVQQLRAETARLQEEVSLLRRERTGEVWLWTGDPAEDDVQSLSRECAVLMTSDQARALLRGAR